jgi:drug/metabolite transporter (DMT)-like permease
MSPRAIGQATLLAVCLIWGMNFTAMHLMLERMHPLDVIFLRTGIAAIGFLIVLAVLRRPRPSFSRAEWGRLLAMGVLGVALFNLATSLGQSVLPASISSLLVSSSPIFTALLAAVLGVERITRRMALALAVATLGMVILVTWGRDASLDLNRDTIVAALLLLVAPASWAAYTVLNKPLLAKHPPLEIAAYGMMIGALLLAPLGIVDPGRIGRIASLDGIGWASVFFSSVFSLIVAFILFSRSLRVLSPNEVAMATYLTPLFAVLIAWGLLGETPTPGLVAGGALIVGAMVLVTTTQPVEQPLEEG